MTITQKILKMKSGSYREFDSYKEALSFRTVAYRLNRKPVSRKTVENKYRIYVFDKDQVPEVTA